MNLIGYVAFLVCSILLSPPENSSENEFAARVVERARQEAINHVDYDASYYDLPYPAGDLPEDVGCCTDLLIRAYRNAGIDLQKEVTEDFLARPTGYPVQNRDELTHRRCRHLVVWFRRHAEERPAGMTKDVFEDCQPGDVVFFNFDKLNKDFPDHVGIVSERPFMNGMPFIYDNLGPEAAERTLNSLPIMNSRFRWREKKAEDPIEPRYAQ